jgi:hypothetical protein
VQKILLPPGFDPQTLQPVASRYANYAILAHRTLKTFIKGINHFVAWLQDTSTGNEKKNKHVFAEISLN